MEMPADTKRAKSDPSAFRTRSEIQQPRIETGDAVKLMPHILTVPVGTRTAEMGDLCVLHHPRRSCQLRKYPSIASESDRRVEE